MVKEGEWGSKVAKKFIAIDFAQRFKKFVLPDFDWHPKRKPKAIPSNEDEDVTPLANFMSASLYFHTNWFLFLLDFMHKLKYCYSRCQSFTHSPTDLSTFHIHTC